MVQTTGWPAILGVAAALMLAAPLHAAETSTTALTFDSCTDPEGRTITVEANRSQAKLVQTVEFQGEPIIHYNPDALPRLTSEVRLLFFAHECARHALKTAGKASLSAMQARQADCVGLNTLITAGLLQRDALADLQQQMVFSAPEWELLPGPPRTIDVTSCPPARGNVLKLPVATPPSYPAGGMERLREYLCRPALALPEGLSRRGLRQLHYNPHAVPRRLRRSAGKVAAAIPSRLDAAATPRPAHKSPESRSGSVASRRSCRRPWARRCGA